MAMMDAQTGQPINGGAPSVLPDASIDQRNESVTGSSVEYAGTSTGDTGSLFYDRHGESEAPVSQEYGAPPAAAPEFDPSQIVHQNYALQYQNMALQAQNQQLENVLEQLRPLEYAIQNNPQFAEGIKAWVMGGMQGALPSMSPEVQGQVAAGLQQAGLQVPHQLVQEMNELKVGVAQYKVDKEIERLQRVYGDKFNPVAALSYAITKGINDLESAFKYWYGETQLGGGPNLGGHGASNPPGATSGQPYGYPPPPPMTPGYYAPAPPQGYQGYPPQQSQGYPGYPPQQQYAPPQYAPQGYTPQGYAPPPALPQYNIPYSRTEAPRARMNAPVAGGGAPRAANYGEAANMALSYMQSNR